MKQWFYDETSNAWPCSTFFLNNSPFNSFQLLTLKFNFNLMIERQIKLLYGQLRVYVIFRYYVQKLSNPEIKHIKEKLYSMA